ncbi:DUF4349 domain-containing protein [uncultured Lacinutrix sp.]|uniref:DUF4349 domain-containing protein n=1 Tax=uncultured Lacinutrix sp. TaxID=574032 RepID=UPI0026350884|nr:DUF4349 domain-containing protein [uncultured Lacinutrix sp.]
MRVYLSIVVILILFGCHQEPSYYKNDSGVLGLVNTSGDYEIEDTIEEMEVTYNMSVPKETSQKIIKESYLEFETNDLDKTFDNIQRYVKQNNGVIQNDNASKNYNRSIRTLIVRVPTNGFQNTIDSISKSVEYFDSKSISSKDVTEEFIDLEARLGAKRVLETRYLQLLSKAKNVKEMLEIERELSSIREEIEAKQGRLKYLNNKVALSTINITFYKTTTSSKITQSYGSKMGKALKSGFNGLSYFFLGVLNIWPFLILLSIGIFFIRKWYKKKMKK